MQILQRIGRLSVGTCLALAASQALYSSNVFGDVVSEPTSESAAATEPKFSLGAGYTAPSVTPSVKPEAFAPGSDSAVYLATAGERRPLMRLFDKWGWAKPLDDAGIEIYGFLQGSYGVNVVDPQADDPLGPNPAQHRIQGRMFDHHNNQLALNRFDVFVQRPVDYTSGKMEYGGLFEMQYGIDAAMMHSNGLFDFDWFDYKNHADPAYQIDLTQLYFDLGIPVGNGLRVRAGKFTTPIGYESCDPTTRTTIQFYSRTWILSMGIPMYHTGAMATYDFTKSLTANFGVTRGWDQSLEDNNSAIDMLATLNYQVSDNLTLFGATSIGPQNPGDNSHWRYLLNGTAYFTPDLNGPWTFALDSIVAWEDNRVFSHGGYQRTAAPAGVSYHQDDDITDDVGDTYWFAVAGFAAYRINPQLVAKARAEWFYDNDGTRWRVPAGNSSYQAAVMNNPFAAVGQSISAFELTLGMDIVPFPNDAKELLVRPEVRLDVADRTIFVNDDRSYQVTVAFDVIYKF